MLTLEKGRKIDSNRTWDAVGGLPPHLQETTQKREAYTELLKKAGAAIVLGNVEELTPGKIQDLI